MKSLFLFVALLISYFATAQLEDLREVSKEGKPIKYLTFTWSGDGYILEDSQRYYCLSVPESLKNGLREIDGKIRDISFFGDDSWCVLYGQNGYSVYNTQPDLVEIIQKAASSGQSIKQVVIGPNSSYCVLYGKFFYSSRNFPADVVAKFKEKSNANQEIKHISFNSSGGWCMLIGENGYSTDGIDSKINDKLFEINEAGLEIHKVVFNKKDTYILYGNTYWHHTAGSTVVESKPPEITITSPKIEDSRGFSVEETATITVTGLAKSTVGISSVKINGIDATVESDGSFSALTPLNPGSNDVRVVATDKNMKSSEKTFSISKKETPKDDVVETKKKCIALILGNSNYTGQSNLGPNPLNDAKDMAATLEALGFEVILWTDVDRSKMTDAIRTFGKQNMDADVALFYFAGHGMQVNKENYLIPVDAKIESAKDIDYECVSVGSVQRIMETSNTERLNLIVLDACRNNPFRSWSRGGATGLADMTPPSGTLVAFATSPGSTAANGTGRNGLYTSALIKQLKKKQRIEDVFINTRIEVEKKSGGSQSPWELARLRGKYYLAE